MAILYLSKVCRYLLFWVFICRFQQLDVIANQNIGRSIWWAWHRCFICDSSSINQYLWGILLRNLLHVCIFVRVTGINLVLTLSLTFRRLCLCTPVLFSLSTQCPVQELYFPHVPESYWNEKQVGTNYPFIPQVSQFLHRNHVGTHRLQILGVQDGWAEITRCAA